ncbi:MAG: YggS family pyridoxal phosphate-dependent enzyme, partial [Burkholderiaceae bacterium]
FDWVQSVDRLKTAERLAEQRPANLPRLNVLLQVNVSGEASKSGVAPDELSQLAIDVEQLPRLRLRGLMAIPAPQVDVAQQRLAFTRTNALFRQLREEGLQVDVLSMGMSDDLEAAIAEGSTMVRIGTAIFGARAPRQ